MAKRCGKCGINGHFARVCRGQGARRQGRQQQSNFVDDDYGEEAFCGGLQDTPTAGKEILCPFTPHTWRENKSRESTNRLGIHVSSYRDGGFGAYFFEIIRSNRTISITTVYQMVFTFCAHILNLYDLSFDRKLYVFPIESAFEYSHQPNRKKSR